MVDASQLLDWRITLETKSDRLIVSFKEKKEDLEIVVASIHYLFCASRRKEDPLVLNPIRNRYLQLNNRKKNIMAIYGIIRLQDFNYLVVVTKAAMIGMIAKKRILLAERFEFIRLHMNTSQPDLQIIAQLQDIFNSKTFYFSQEYDLTTSLQDQLSGVDKPTPQFFINQHCLSAFLASNTESYVPIFISGLVTIKYVRVNETDCELMLITRRDKRRMGRRFISRGTDQDGNCTNFAETEQILSCFVQDENLIYSFVQTRGSMPFRWQQKPNLKWNPKAQVIGTESQNVGICKKHFDDSNYKEQVLVNLIDKKGTQKTLGDYYARMVQTMKNPSLRYVWFDFHHECRNMKYENLSQLIDMIKNELQQYGYFSVSSKAVSAQKKKILSKQTGVIRTNCIDCLDRTNVVQSVIARHLLWEAVKNIGVNKPGVISTFLEYLQPGALEKFPSQLESIFREMWTKNADVVSTLYTGTGALKTDFTRTGKRTFRGALQDGKNAVVRYVLNNFYDGDTQNSFDIVTGKLDLTRHRMKRVTTNPIWSLVVMFTVFLPLLTHLAAGNISQTSTVQEYLGDETSQSYTYKYMILLFGVFGVMFQVLKTLTFSRPKHFIRKPIVES